MNIKSKIISDWQKAFTNLSVYSTFKIYKIVGPIIIGLELIRIPREEAYRPHFVVYPLWKTDIKSCLEVPLILSPLLNKKGLLFDISFLKHEEYLRNAQSEARKQFEAINGGNIPVSILDKLVDSRFNDILVKSNSAEKAKLYEFRLFNALYLGDKTKFNKIQKQILEAKKNWDMAMFEMWYGSFDNWFDDMSKIDRERLLKQINTNKSNPKLSKLGSYELENQ